MKKSKLLIPAFLFTVVSLAVLSCNDKAGSVKNEETMTAGTAVFLVDNTVQPIVEDVIAVYENMYDRVSITQVNKSEAEVLRDFLADSAGVAVMSRKLTAEEEAHFKNKKINPKVTEFATDAIALIANKASTDTVIKLEEIIKVLKGEPSKVKKLVFDNPNSSTVQYFLKLAGIAKLPSSGVYALRTNEDVIKHVHDNNGTIGIVGLNWIVQSPPSLTQIVENIQVLAVNNVNVDPSGNKYYKPNQSNIGAGLYPLTRKLYVLNYQGTQGLGMGFANFVSAPDGQRIILKSGLMPVNIPNRELEVRNEL